MARESGESMREPGMRERDGIGAPEGVQERRRDRENPRDPEGPRDRRVPRDPEGMEGTEDRDRRERRGSDAGMPGSGDRERVRGDQRAVEDDDEMWADGYR
ncbi:hypothetical protein ACFYP4_13845 [Streptomyces sp. NPDC005551]|uniref:hypothetical protein n=1 Tax=Streptomyces sp. NPDC005551 TaxID=3364725 RepID=UPI0036CD6AEA